MRTLRLLIIILFLGSVPIMANDYKDFNDRGVDAYKQKNYDSSLYYFEQAHDLNPEDDTVKFNLGNAFHQQGKYPEALESFGRSAAATDSSLSAQAYYNIGNTYYRAGSLDSAAMAYMASLDYDPGDKDTKYNLELTLKKIEEQEQQKQEQQDSQDQNQEQNKKDQQDQQDKQDQDQKDQQNQEQQDQEQDKQDQGEKDQDKKEQDQKDQQNQEQDKQNQDKQDQGEQGQDKKEQEQDSQDQQQQKQQNSDENTESSDQGQAPQPMQLDEERAKALLEGLNDDEKEVLKQVIKQKVGVSPYQGKNW